jgi:hypothetical protein
MSRQRTNSPFELAGQGFGQMISHLFGGALSPAIAADSIFGGGLPGLGNCPTGWGHH